MGTNQKELTYIHKPYFPPSLVVAKRSLRRTNLDKNQIQVENNSGKNILREMIAQKLNSEEPDFITRKYEKPQAFVNGIPLSISFAHTPTEVCAALSDRWVVGVDMESTQRQVSESLQSRMKHRDEKLKLYEQHPIIQIWTMKEAALKAIGTGLRKPMNSVQLSVQSDYLFSAEFDNGIKSNICSFKEDNQWISICFISSQLSESLLSESYVPIHPSRDQGKTQ